MKLSAINQILDIFLHWLSNFRSFSKSRSLVLLLPKWNGSKMIKMSPRIQNSKLSLVKKIPMDAILLLSAQLPEVRLVNLPSKPSMKWAKQVLEPMSKLTVRILWHNLLVFFALLFWNKNIVNFFSQAICWWSRWHWMFWNR